MNERLGRKRSITQHVKTMTFSTLAAALVTLALTACSSPSQPPGEALVEPDAGSASETSEAYEGSPPRDALGETPVAQSTNVSSPPTDSRVFASDLTGLSFSFPAEWYGPDIVEWDGGLRVEVGSDIVYPYGTGRDERTYERTNSYFVVVQLNQNRSSLSLEELRQDQPWLETYFTLLQLADGESVTGARELITRVGQVEVDGFTGIEYIATLSETAQTERFYAREAILLDEHFNVLRVTGSPNSVDVPNPTAWREAYRQVNEVHAAVYERLLDSITFE